MTSNRCGARRPVAGGHVGAEIECGFGRVAQEAADFEQLRRRHDDRPVADVEADLLDAAGNGGLQRGDERGNLGAGGRRRIGRARRRRRLGVVRGGRRGLRARRGCWRGFAAACSGRSGLAAAAAGAAGAADGAGARRIGARHLALERLSGSVARGLVAGRLGVLGLFSHEFVARALPRPSRARLSSRRRRIRSPESPGR